jgi:hypothetical protein
MHFTEFYHSKQVWNPVFSAASVVPTSQFEISFHFISMNAILVLQMTGTDKIPEESFLSCTVLFLWCSGH